MRDKPALKIFLFLAVTLIAIMLPFSKGAFIEVAGLSLRAEDIEDIEGFKSSDTLTVEALSQESQEIMEQVEQVASSPQEFLSSYEVGVLESINAVRAANGLGPLEANAHLSDIAASRSQDMLSRDYFSHYTPEGTNIFNILAANGVVYRNAGENLAHSRPADIGSVSAFMDAWMASPGHRANILRGAYGMIGIGEVSNGSRRVVTTVFKNS